MFISAHGPCSEKSKEEIKGSEMSYTNMAGVLV